ncbi:MAG TPA: ribosomal protein S18-alanine N-acetyltransferase [Gammaproteobacteria bacterium]|nr:ribosomal protein S18-alanine N-acetyltransferase [Gammaproteobacteria bacterium]
MSAVLKDPLVEFRPMNESDLADILQIETIAYTHPWTERIFQDCLRVGYCCWVISRAGIIIGYGVMSVAAAECHLLNLCVHPDEQNRGFGSMMLEKLLYIARKHKADTAFLEVRPSNINAIQLYRNAGFDEVGMRRNYYPAEFGREDAIILARSLH